MDPRTRPVHCHPNEKERTKESNSKQIEENNVPRFCKERSINARYDERNSTRENKSGQLSEEEFVIPRGKTVEDRKTHEEERGKCEKNGKIKSVFFPLEIPHRNTH